MTGFKETHLVVSGANIQCQESSCLFIVLETGKRRKRNFESVQIGQGVQDT